MRLASGRLSPIIVAIFVALLCFPLMRRLQSKGVPTWAALLLLIIAVLTLGVALILFGFFSLSQVRDRLPAYQANWWRCSHRWKLGSRASRSSQRPYACGDYSNGWKY